MKIPLSKSFTDVSYGAGLKRRRHPIDMRLKIRRLLRSFLPVPQLGKPKNYVNH